MHSASNKQQPEGMTVTRRLRPQGEDGITMIETVVAMLVFTVFAVIAARFLVSTLDVDRSNTRRVAAANLAAQQIELARATSVLNLPDGRTVLPNQPVLAGTTYTVTQDVGFVAGQSGGSVCSSTGKSLTYKRIGVTVTWPDMGSVKPVRADTVKVLGLGPNEADVRKGAAAVEVNDQVGQPQSGVTVSLSPSGRSATTGDDGCVVFPNLDPAITHTASLAAAGFVDQQGDPAPMTAVNVEAGTVSRTTTTYARKGGLQLNLTAPAGYPIPAQLGVTVDSSILTPTRSRAFPQCAGGQVRNCTSGTGATKLASALFPGTYSAWAGTCADAKPGTPPTTTVQGGGNASVQSALGGIRVTLSGNNLTYLRNSPLYVVHVTDSASCQGGEVFELQRISDADRRAAVPSGTWKLALNSDGSNVVSGDIIVSAPNPQVINA